MGAALTKVPTSDVKAPSSSDALIQGPMATAVYSMLSALGAFKIRYDIWDSSNKVRF